MRKKSWKFPSSPPRARCVALVRCRAQWRPPPRPRGPRGPRSACAGRPCRGGPRREPAEVEVRVGVGRVADLDARVLEGLVGFEVHELRAEQARGPVQRVPERVRERVGARGSKCSPRWTSCRGRAALSGAPARGRRRRSRPAPRRDVRAQGSAGGGSSRRAAAGTSSSAASSCTTSSRRTCG